MGMLPAYRHKRKFINKFEKIAALKNSLNFSDEKISMLRKIGSETSCEAGSGPGIKPGPHSNVRMNQCC
jgi:hypothetical protein